MRMLSDGDSGLVLTEDMGRSGLEGRVGGGI
jgi:hypothetical protein